MARKIALYTVLTGGYDTPRPINTRMTSGIDCFMVTDDAANAVQGWTAIVVPKEDDPHRQQRRLKLLFHTIPELTEYDTVVYIDASLDVVRPLQQLLSQYSGGMMTFMHPKRTCVYDEGWACIDQKKAEHQQVKEQLSAYILEGVRPGSGMYQTGCMVRDRSEAVIAFCEEWHRELTKHTHRDQLSIVPARDRIGIAIKAVPTSTFRALFVNHPHRCKTKPVIHYLTPYSTEKNIGKAYNEAIDRVGDDNDWIVVRDGDTLFPTPDWGRHIEDALSKAGDQYALIGAMTNRIGGEHQRAAGMWDVWDMRDHVRKAKEMEGANWGVVEETNLGVAGFFMAFRKKTWRAIKFTEKTNESRLFDTVFYKAVRSRKMRVGIMKGLYIVHLYRPLSDSPRTDVKHLV